MGAKVPGKPLVFMKPASALLIKNRPFYYPDFSNNIHYEVELVLRICKNGKRVQSQFARTYYDAVGLGIDFTARDLQAKCKEKGHPWEIAKAFDFSAAISGFRDIGTFDGGSIDFRLEKNGEIVQRGNTDDLIFSFDELICYLSTYFKLQLGDLIYTGTPQGVGPVERGDVLNGFLREEHLLRCEIK